jgi:hypothetical protein
MWRLLDMLLTDVSEERIASIFRATRSSETSVNKISTRSHIPEEGILHSHRRDNLKSYIIFPIFGEAGIQDKAVT